MTTELETEGRSLMAFVAALAGALGVVADHVTASVVDPQLSNVLDEAVRALERDIEALQEGLRTNSLLSDPWALSLAKILTEVAASLQAFVAVLATAELTWWTRRFDELGRRQGAEPEDDVDVEADDAAD